jgi:hypothetical protein
LTTVHAPNRFNEGILNCLCFGICRTQNLYCNNFHFTGGKDSWTDYKAKDQAEAAKTTEVMCNKKTNIFAQKL